MKKIFLISLFVVSIPFFARSAEPQRKDDVVAACENTCSSLYNWRVLGVGEKVALCSMCAIASCSLYIFYEAPTILGKPDDGNVAAYVRKTEAEMSLAYTTCACPLWMIVVGKSLPSSEVLNARWRMKRD